MRPGLALALLLLAAPAGAVDLTTQPWASCTVTPGAPVCGIPCRWQLTGEVFDVMPWRLTVAALAPAGGAALVRAECAGGLAACASLDADACRMDVLLAGGGEATCALVGGGAGRCCVWRSTAMLVDCRPWT